MKQIIGKALFRATCRRCKTLFDYTYDEVKEYRDTDYTGSTDVYDIVTCPVCEGNVTHKP